LQRRESSFNGNDIVSGRILGMDESRYSMAVSPQKMQGGTTPFKTNKDGNYSVFLEPGKYTVITLETRHSLAPSKVFCNRGNPTLTSRRSKVNMMAGEDVKAPSTSCESSMLEVLAKLVGASAVLGRAIAIPLKQA
jgi:hypothetical protein